MPAIVQTLNTVECPVEFTSEDKKLIKKVVQVLKPFEEATKMLSDHDASISMVIPIVTMILRSLEINAKDDFGVIGMKRSLKYGMNQDNRFGGIESKIHYALATLLDAKWKRHFFRDPNTLGWIKNVAVDKIVESLIQDADTEVLFIMLTVSA